MHKNNSLKILRLDLKFLDLPRKQFKMYRNETVDQERKRDNGVLLGERSNVYKGTSGLLRERT